MKPNFTIRPILPNQPSDLALQNSIDELEKCIIESEVRAIQERTVEEYIVAQHVLESHEFTGKAIPTEELWQRKHQSL